MIAFLRLETLVSTELVEKYFRKNFRKSYTLPTNSKSVPFRLQNRTFFEVRTVRKPRSEMNFFTREVAQCRKKPLIVSSSGNPDTGQQNAKN